MLKKATCALTPNKPLWVFFLFLMLCSHCCFLSSEDIFSSLKNFATFFLPRAFCLIGYAHLKNHVVLCGGATIRKWQHAKGYALHAKLMGLEVFVVGTHGFGNGTYHTTHITSMTFSNAVL